ncbi:MAG TPA: hypothetical protein VGE24_03765, partial [Emticicia sp.]
MSQEEPIILHPRNNSFELVIPLVLFSTLFTVTFLISVVDVRWDVVVISLILLAIPITIISEFYKKIYVFYSNKLVIESCKNKYLDEIRIEDIVSWNEHSTQRKGKSRYYLLIKAAGKNLFIERGSYENYKAVIEYLRNSPIPVDKSLKPGAIIIDDLVI